MSNQQQENIESELNLKTNPRYIRVLQSDLEKEENLSKADIKELLNDLQVFYGERVNFYLSERIRKRDDESLKTLVLCSES